MCSYHIGNQLYVSRDWDLQHSLQLSRRCKDDFEPHKVRSYEPDALVEENEGVDSDQNYKIEEDQGGTFVFGGVCARKNQEEEHKVLSFCALW